MQSLFGDYLLKYKEPTDQQDGPIGDEALKLEAANVDVADEGQQVIAIKPKSNNYSTPILTSEALGGENLRYIGVLFSAEYCPPCQRLHEPLQQFYDEMTKSGAFDMVLVNCDKREKEYKENFKNLNFLHALPFDVDDSILAKLEEISNADVIPKLVVYSVEKGFEKPLLMDIKQIILKNQNQADSATQVMEKIQLGLENFDSSKVDMI